MERTLKAKSLQGFNAQDLYRIWGQEYQKNEGRTLQGIPGRDLMLLKRLLTDGFSAGEIIMAMREASRQGVNLQVFYDKFDSFEVLTDPVATWYYRLESKAPDLRHTILDLVSQWWVMESGERIFRDSDKMATLAKQIEELLK